MSADIGGGAKEPLRPERIGSREHVRVAKVDAERAGGQAKVGSRLRGVHERGLPDSSATVSGPAGASASVPSTRGHLLVQRDQAEAAQMQRVGDFPTNVL